MWYNPVVTFHIGSLPISVYGIIIAAAILVAFLVGLLLFKKLKWRDDTAFLILFICVPLGIVCARLYYVLFSLHEFTSFWQIFQIWNGGIAIYGAVVGGAFGLWLVARIKKVGFFVLADVVVICLILGQAIGRWGNFFNQEVYGFAVQNHVPPFTVEIDGRYGTRTCDCAGESCVHLATFFLESVMNLIGFGVMLFLFFRLRNRGKYRWGFASGFYLVWYGITRAILEPLRDPHYILKIAGNNPIVFNQVSFMLSIALIALGVIILYFTWKKKTSQVTPEATKTDT